MKRLNLLALACLVAALAVGTPGRAHAQQTIVNMPSADLTPAGQGFVMHESFVGVKSGQPVWSATHFAVLGVTDFVEAYATNFNLDHPNTFTNVTAVGAKAVLPMGHAQRTSPGTVQAPVLTLGGAGVWASRGGLPGAMGYAHVSMRAPHLRTRVALGALGGTHQIFGRNAFSGMASVEQPLGHRLALVGEWLMGDHDLSGLIAGFNLHPHPRVILVGGVKVPNLRAPRASDNGTALWADMRGQVERGKAPGLIFEVGFFSG